MMHGPFGRQLAQARIDQLHAEAVRSRGPGPRGRVRRSAGRALVAVGMRLGAAGMRLGGTPVPDAAHRGRAAAGG